MVALSGSGGDDGRAAQENRSVLEESASRQSGVLDPSSTGPRQELLLELSDGWKSFGHVIALSGAYLRAYGGEILALVGDNGAGKSTLLKVFSGLYALDRGSVRVAGVSDGPS